MKQETIDKAIAEYNFTDAKIAEIKEKYLSLKVKDASDMDGYLECKEGHQEVKKYLKDVEDKRKDLNGDARKYTKGVNGRAKEIREELEPVRDYLGTHLKEKASKL